MTVRRMFLISVREIIKFRNLLNGKMIALLLIYTIKNLQQTGSVRIRAESVGKAVSNDYSPNVYNNFIARMKMNKYYP